MQDAMNNNSILTSVKHSALRALIGVFLFLVAHNFYNIELIREKSTDVSFDLINELWFSNIETSTNTQAIVFSVDNYYLRQNKLLDEHNNTTYGYLFPRSYIAKFIKSVDKRSVNQETPIALFIDYDMRYTSVPDNQSLSDDDLKLLEALAGTDESNRPYPILLATTASNTFIERFANGDYGDQHDVLASKLKTLIQNKQIIFVSVKMLQSKDGIYRMHRPYLALDGNRDHDLYSFGTVGWQLASNGKIDRNEIDENFDSEIFTDNKKMSSGYSIISSNILFKNITTSTRKENNVTYTTKNSNWLDCRSFSAHVIDLNISTIKNRIVLFGSDHANSDDIFQVSTDYSLQDDSSIPVLSGIQMHANTLMTMLYLDGSIKPLSPYLSALLIFIIFITVDLFVQYRLKKLSSFARFSISLVCIFIPFIALSGLLLIYAKIWFNWAFPLLFFYVEEIFDIIKRLVSFKQRKKED